MALFPGTRPHPEGASLLKEGDSLLLPAVGGEEVKIAPASGASTWKMTLPPGPGSNGQILTTDGAGITTWEDAPAGVDTFIGLTDTPGSYVNGDVYYASGGALVRLGIGAEDQILTSKSGVPSWEPSQTGGVTTFLGLSDTPSSYAGQGGRAVAVNGGGTALEFIDFPSGGVTDFLGLSDTPGTYAGAAGFVVRVNATPNALEYVDGLTLFEQAGAVSDHVAQADPHPQYLETSDPYVVSFNTRTGAVVPQQSDYDAFFLTPAEGDAAYAPLSHVGDTGAAHGVFTDTVNGFAPSSGGGTTNFLRADGQWAAPPSGGSVSFLDLTDSPASYAGQAGKVVAVNGTEDGVEFVAGGGGGGASLAIDLPPYASEPPNSNFATLSTRAAGVDDPRPTLIYADSGLVVAAMWTTHVPPGYGGGDLRFTVDWAGENGGTGGDVVWRVRIEPIADDSTDITIAPTWTTIGTVNDTAPAATQKTSAQVSGDPGAISAGQLLRVRLERVGNDAGDTLAAGAECFGLLLEEL